MALNDGATLVIGSGNYLTALVGTPLPAQPARARSAGGRPSDTSLEDILSVSSEGGEATMIGTLQNKALRTRYSPRTDTLAFPLQQFDKPGLRLYYGANAPELADGTIGVPNDPVPTICAFLAIFIDGVNVFGFYAPRSEVYRNDDLSIADTESLAGLPLGVKPLPYLPNRWAYAVTPLGAVEASGANVGTPGTPTPHSVPWPPPVSSSCVRRSPASPTTAWTTGQYVILADASEAHWDGDSWETGLAA